MDKTGTRKEIGEKMKAIGCIPARFGSTRFPGKPLVPLLGKPLLQWVVERAKESKTLSEVVVATDDRRIADVAERSGARVVMTDPDLPSGSDRVWAAAKTTDCDIVLNIQGDEPLITGPTLDLLVDALKNEPAIKLATLGRPMTDDALDSPNTAKIVLNQNNEALYFSRLPIPYSRGAQGVTQYVCMKHIGIYGFRKEFLGQFCENGPVLLEQAEGLEQLRALYLGARIKVVPTTLETWGVDTPEDVLRVEDLLKRFK
jgi:3-deoxy-manno-octulosonate cytidylyltransferase (CMP-KDO synthetase)